MASENPTRRSMLARLRDWLFPRQTQAPLPAPEPASRTGQALLLEQFLRLRRAGWSLGIDELFAALDAVEGGWGANDSEELAEVARLLWCKSRRARLEFDLHWESIGGSDLTPEALQQSPQRAMEELPRPQPPEPVPQAESQPGVGETSRGGQAASLGVLPIRIPYMPAPVGGDSLVSTYWPLSRRAMIYAWRYLRRPALDGPKDVLDVEATVAEAARQGFYLAPMYSRREINHAKLILLVDQGGSMTPLHRFTRDLVETAQHESSLQDVETFYFHNLPHESLYLDPHLTQRLPTEQVLNQIDGDTSVLIVSDAGAARRFRHLPRVRATSQFLSGLKFRTALVTWLNPIPRERWEGSSAQLIAHMISMFPMDPDGLNDAVRVLRGQS